MKPLVIVTEPLASAPSQWLANECDVIQAAPGHADFIAAAPRAQGLAIRTATRVDAQLLAQLPQLKVIARAGVGLDNIDLAACKARGIRMVHTQTPTRRPWLSMCLRLCLTPSVRAFFFLHQWTRRSGKMCVTN